MKRRWVFYCWVVLIVTAPACDRTPAKDCGDEERSAVTYDKDITESAGFSVVDPTARGKLSKPSPSRHNPKKSILLLDYSGSMYGGYGVVDPPQDCEQCAARPRENTGKMSRNKQPFFVDTQPFQDLLAQWLAAAVPKGRTMRMEILLYNGRVWRLNDKGKVVELDEDEELTFSRKVKFKDVDKVKGWVQAIPNSPYKVNGRAPNTTEAAAALERVLSSLGKRESIIWMLTDNVVEHETFYKKIRDEARLQMVSVYPIHEERVCSWLCGSSLLMYGFYSSPHLRPDADALHHIGGTLFAKEAPQKTGLLWSPALRKVARKHSGKARKSKSGRKVAGAPMRIKPIDAEVLAFNLEIKDGQALRCQRDKEFGEDLKCFARAYIRNALRHQVIETASLSFTNSALLPRAPDSETRLPWAPAVCGGEMEVVKWKVKGGDSGDGGDSISIGPLAPLEVLEVELLFRLPGGKPSYTSLQDLTEVGFTEKIYLVGTIRADIEDIKTKMVINPRDLKGVYGASELPAIFKKRTQSRLQVQYPAAAVVQNDGQALGLLLAIASAFLAVLLLFAGVLLKKSRYTFTWENRERSLRIGLTGYKHKDGGKVIFVLRHLPLLGIRVSGGAGVQIKGGGGQWQVTRSGESGSPRRLEVRRGR